MHRSALAAIALLILLVSVPAPGRDERLRFLIADALATPDAKAKIDPAIRLYFGAEEHPKPLQSFGTDTTDKKADFYNARTASPSCAPRRQEDKSGCEWVFLSAVLQLQKRARELGANAVIDIASVYEGGNLVSETEYECGAGYFIGGVALRGEFVKLP